jgi:uncharacterized protein (TIGR02246 family)
MNPSASILLDELACQRLIERYFRALDAGDAHAVAGLFAPDGIWRRGENSLQGYEAVRAAVLARKSNVVTRHFVTNIDVHIIDETRAAGLSYYMLYRHEMKPDESAPFPTRGPIRSGENLHRFVKADGEWKLAFTQARPIFTAVQEQA